MKNTIFSWTHLLNNAPKSVRDAVKLVAGSMFLALFSLPTIVEDIDPESTAASWLIIIAISIIFGGLMVFFLAKLIARKNWARWAVVIYLIIGFWFVAADLPDHWERLPVVALFEIVCTAMEICAVCLLLNRETRTWFASTHTPQANKHSEA